MQTETAEERLERAKANREQGLMIEKHSYQLNLDKAHRRHKRYIREIWEEYKRELIVYQIATGQFVTAEELASLRGLEEEGR